MKKILIMVLLLGILLIDFTCAQNYISGQIEILDNGFVSIDGESNIDPEIENINFIDGKLSGDTSALISKEGEIWTFNLDIDKNYSEINFELFFPENTNSIESINSNLKNNIRLGKQMSIKFFDSDKPIYSSVDYTMSKKLDYNWISILALVLVVIILIFFLFKRKKINKLDVISDLLSEKEEKIVNSLMKKPIRQNELRKKLDIPKASFSRYMLNLEKKKIILREGEGKNKLVRLK